MSEFLEHVAVEVPAVVVVFNQQYKHRLFLAGPASSSQYVPVQSRQWNATLWYDVAGIGSGKKLLSSEKFPEIIRESSSQWTGCPSNNSQGFADVRNFNSGCTRNR